MTTPARQPDLNFINWTEIRAAYMVGELKTLTRAAQHLGVHRSTLMRQITALETRIGRRIFKRDRDGYRPTEFGHELIAAARQVDHDFQELYLTDGSANLSIGGHVAIAAPSELAGLITMVLPKLEEQCPDVWCRFISTNDDDIEVAEGADIVLSLRDDHRPEYPVQNLTQLQHSLFASRQYIERHGRLEDWADLTDHKFVCKDQSANADVTDTWLKTNVPARSIIFRSTSQHALFLAIEQGVGIGFLPTKIAIANTNLVQILEPLEAWAASVWISIRQKQNQGQKIQLVVDELRRSLRE